MHADASMGAWAVFHPASVEAVVGFELTPVGHGRAFEAPSGGFFVEVTFSEDLSGDDGKYNQYDMNLEKLVINNIFYFVNPKTF